MIYIRHTCSIIAPGPVPLGVFSLQVVAVFLRRSENPSFERTISRVGFPLPAQGSKEQ